MTVSKESPGAERSSVCSDTRRRFLQKRYLLSWILAAILPFILLRLLFVSEVTFPFHSEAVSSLGIALQPEGNVSHEQSSATVSSLVPDPGSENVKSNTTVPESPLIRPDEDAWITHDNWNNHKLNRTQDDKVISAGFENSTELLKDFSSVKTNGEDFGLPEDNDKEDQQHESKETVKKGENTAEENTTSAEEVRTHEVRTQVDEMQQQQESIDEKKDENEKEKQVEVNEENVQQDKSQEAEKIKEETKLPEDEPKPTEQVAKEEDRPQHQREEHEETKLPEEGQEPVEQAGKEEDKPQPQQQEEQEAKPSEQVDKEEHNPQQQGNEETELPRSAEEGQQPLEQVDKDEEKHEETNPPKIPEEEQKPVEQVDKEEDKQHQQREEHEETVPKLPEEEQVHKEEDGPQQEKPAGACDLFEGEWEHDPEGPLYTNSTCSFIQQYQDCLSNGRPDTEYLYWRWKPRDCDLPRFDAKSFLDKFRGKGIAFIGDSISRNQFQSLLCMLAQVETPLLKDQSNGGRTNGYLFKEHQFTLEVIWAPYILNYSEDGGDLVLGKDRFLVHLDVLDPAWTSVMQEFDILVFSSGQWYLRASIYLKQQEIVGCHYCPGFNLTDISYYDAYRGAIRQVFEKVSDDGFKGVAIMNTFPVSHFEYGQWDKGGECKRTQPLQSQEAAQVAGEHNKMRSILFEEFNANVDLNREPSKDKRVEILDVTKVAIKRADGHPGRFGRPHWDPAERKVNDCLHWCLPGPIDVWNEVLDRLLDKYL